MTLQRLAALVLLLCCCAWAAERSVAAPLPDFAEPAAVFSAPGTDSAAESVESWRLASLWPTTTPAPAQTPLPAVVRVITVDRDSMSLGSGTLVDTSQDYGLVITNWHVVRDAVGPVEVVFPSGFHSMARVVRTDREWDLAALLIWKPPGVSPVSVTSVAPKPGEMLTIAGYGRGDYKMQSGPCTEYLAPAPGRPAEIVELAAAARHGDSGGPILNTRGELAGVLFGEGGGHTDGSYGGRVHKFLELTALDLRTLPASSPVAEKASGAIAANVPAARPASGLAASTARFDGGINSGINSSAREPQNQADWNAWETARLAAKPNEPSGAMGANNGAGRPLNLAAEGEAKTNGPEYATPARGVRFAWLEELKSFMAAFGVAAILLHLMRFAAQ
jgi:hypothetical protein